MDLTFLELGLYIFILSGFLGFHLITRVPPLLHTPLMSATNAISGISLIGSLIMAGSKESTWLSTILGFLAVTCSATNVFGGFLITDRMLKMFKSKSDQGKQRVPIVGIAIVAVVVLIVALLVVLWTQGALKNVEATHVLT